MFSVLYRSINSNRTWKAQDQTLCHMPTVWPDSSVVNIHPHSERVLGSSSGRVMGGCVDDTCEEKAYDQMGTRTRDLSQTVQIL